MENQHAASGAIVVQKHGRIARLIVSNPARRNAMTRAMWEDLPRKLSALAEDGEVRAVVVTGEGDRAFVSGADISEFASQRGDAQTVAAYERQVGLALGALRDVAKPVIARINGHCIGGGLALALCCDLRIAAHGARLGIPAARLGLGYEYPGLHTLTSLVGPAKATEMMFTARLYDASQALAMGLLHEVCEPAMLDASVDALANEIAALAPLSILAAKRGIRAAAEHGDPERVGAAQSAIARCAASRDYAEGIAAFAARRPAIFTGQ